MLRLADPGGRVYGAVGASNVNILQYWVSISTQVGTVSVSSGTGRTGNTSIRYAYTSGSNWYIGLGKVFESRATWGVAFAMHVDLLQPPQNVAIITFYDSGTNQCDVRLNNTGNFVVTRNGTVLGISSISVPANTWFHVEFKATIHPSAGTVDLWINGVSAISLTGQNTRATANSSANQIIIGYNTNFLGFTGPGVSFNVDLDDIVIYDAQTTDAQGNADITGPISDCGVSWLLPSGAGTTTNFTPDSGSNYARVADTTLDTTSYVQSNNINDIDSYALTDLSSTVTQIKTAAIVNYCRKIDTGSRQVKALVRIASTNYLNGNAIDLSDTGQYLIHNWGCNPNTTIVWTATEINNLEIGQKVTA